MRERDNRGAAHWPRREPRATARSSSARKSSRAPRWRSDARPGLAARRAPRAPADPYHRRVVREPRTAGAARRRLGAAPHFVERAAPLYRHAAEEALRSRSAGRSRLGNAAPAHRQRRATHDRPSCRHARQGGQQWLRGAPLPRTNRFVSGWRRPLARKLPVSWRRCMTRSLRAAGCRAPCGRAVCGRLPEQTGEGARNSPVAACTVPMQAACRRRRRRRSLTGVGWPTGSCGQTTIRFLRSQRPQGLSRQRQERGAGERAEREASDA